MSDTKKHPSQTDRASQASQASQTETPERGTAEAAQKEASEASAPAKDGATSRGREPITTQNRTSSDE